MKQFYAGPHYCVRLWRRPFAWRPFAHRRTVVFAAGWGPFAFQVMRTSAHPHVRALIQAQHRHAVEVDRAVRSGQRAALTRDGNVITLN